MTDTELQELEARIAVRVFKWRDVEFYQPPNELMEPEQAPFWRGHPTAGSLWQAVPRYAHDAAASDTLDDALIRALPIGYSVSHAAGLWWFDRPDQDSADSVFDADKKMARVLFARVVFEL